MFYSVVLIEDKTNLCVPASWIFLLDIVKGQKYGMNRNEKKRVFFSPNLATAPNFLLPLRKIFEANENGCYLAKIKDVFYTMDDCKKAMEKYRGGLPAVYNTMRYCETTPSFTIGEKSVRREMENQRDIKVEVAKQVSSLRRSVIMRNENSFVCDLTEDDIDLTTSDSDGEDYHDHQNAVVVPSSSNLRFGYGEGTSAQARECHVEPSSAEVDMPVSLSENVRLGK